MMKIIRNTYFALPAVLLLTGATACSDDSDADFATSDSRMICFSVTTAATSPASRAAVGDAQALKLSIGSGAADNSLWLVPSTVRTAQSGSDSRAVAIDGSSIADFGVYARLTSSSQPALYMDNVAVSRSNLWMPREEYLWPGQGTLSFVAYSPYTAAPEADGITALPDYAADGTFTLDFATPASVADQFDLLRAIPVEASSSPCSLQFEHTLTAIQFAAGNKLAPCHIDRIEITGIASKATLDLTDGSWTDLSEPASFVVEPDCTLAAAEGSKYVAPSTPITADDMTLMLLPQTLGDSASLTLTLTTASGTQTELTTSLADVTWVKGTTVTYNLSADTATQSLTIGVYDADGNRLDSIASPYTGFSKRYTVKSSYIDNSGATTPIAWTASFIDADGNTLDSQPDWIASLPLKGSGDADSCAIVTQMAEPEFLAMSSHTATMRKLSDINASSGHTPYNLSSADGSATVSNTANCYVINAPGRYSIPLVYGNAIKDGAPNTAAYISTISSTTTHNKKALLNFINHLGNPITDPYIYNNTDCTPASASLEWEDRLNIVRNVSLSDDGHSIVFDVPAASFRQGNADVAVKDADGNVMWSWHLWLTDFRIDSGWLDIDDPTGTETALMRVPIGHLYGGDHTLFPRRTATIRFTQVDTPDGLEAATVDIPVALEAKSVYIGDCYTYFQWGRKDPMISGLDVYYNAAHQELSAVSIPTEAPTSSHKDMIVSAILHPQLFIAGDDASLSPLRSSGTFYQNLWSINQIDLSVTGPYAAGVKTIYDPSPAGAKVSVGNAFYAIRSITGTMSTSEAGTKTMAYTLPSGQEFRVPMLGYRSGRWTSPTVGSGESWIAYARNPTGGCYYSFPVSGQISQQHLNILYGYAVFPVADR